MTNVRTVRRLNRILGMLPWVMANEGASVADVCERFGYGNRSELLKDLNLVFVCGLPGYGPGDLMWAEIDDDEVVIEMADYFSAPLRLTAPEALGLLAAGMALVSTGQAPPALARAVEKLGAVVLPEGLDALIVDLSEPAMVGDLRRAAAEGIVTRIVHTRIAGGDTRTRDIEPWSVFAALGNWYVAAWDRSVGAERVFRVDRIQSLEETEERFTPPEEPPAPVVRYTPGDHDVRCTIRLGPRARWVLEHYPVDVVDDDGSGSVTIEFAAADATVAARLLLRLGGDASLVAGDEVRAALDGLKARILERYGAGGDAGMPHAV